MIFALWILGTSTGVFRPRRIGPARQTNPVWPRTFGWTAAAFLWGLDLGSGLTTQSTYTSYWLLPTLVVAAADPIIGAWSYLAFAAARALPILLGPVLPAESPMRFLELRLPFRSIDAIAAGLAMIYSVALVIG